VIIKIKKRDGRTVTFNIEKIAGAIYKAAQSVGKDNYEEALELSGKVVDKLMEKHLDMPTVEEIQDCVERVLIEEGMADTAKSYILYRSNRTRAREMNTRLMKVYEDLTFQSAKDNDLKRETAIPQWVQCLNTDLWEQRSSMRCMFLLLSIQRLIRRGISTFMILIFIH